MEVLLIVNSFIMAIMAISIAMLFFTLRFPDHIALNNYKISRKVMAFVYLSVGSANLVHFATLIFEEAVTGMKTNEAPIIAGLYIIVSSCQAFLVTYSLIVLINPGFVTIRTVFFQLIPFSLLSIFTITALLSDNQILLKTATRIFSLYYVFQLVFYTCIFFKEEKKFRKEADNYFSNDESLRLKWIRMAFLSLLGIGIWALLVVLYPQVVLLERSFSIACIFFYLYFGIRYLNYVPSFQILAPVIIHEKEIGKIPIVDFNYTDLLPKLESWIAKKSFTKSGITVSELARELNTNRTYLSNYINSNKNMNFNRWINSLRIEEAKEMIKNNPKLSLDKLSETLGYTELSSFSKQFTIIEGQSPSNWKKDNVEMYCNI